MSDKNDSDLKNKLPDSVSGLNGSVSPEDLEKINTKYDTKIDTKTNGYHPWDKQFDTEVTPEPTVANEEQEQQPTSRVAKKQKKRGVKTLVMALFAVLVILMFIPVFNWISDSKANSQPNTSKVAKKSSKSDSSSKKKSADKKKEADKKKAEEEAAAKKKADEEKAAADANNESQANQQQESNTQQQSTAANTQAADTYYTVKNGDNPFRIAYNHNLTTDQLYAINGLAPGTVLQPGMRLRVK